MANQNNVGLIFKPDFKSGDIIIESKQNGQETGHQSLKCPFKAGDPFEIMILIEQDEFEIAVNGELFTKVKHVVPPKDLRTILVDGDVHIVGVNFFHEEIDEDDANNFDTAASKPYQSQGRGSVEETIKSAKTQGVKADYSVPGAAETADSLNYNSYYASSNNTRASPAIGFNIPSHLMTGINNNSYNQSPPNDPSNFSSPQNQYGTGSGYNVNPTQTNTSTTHNPLQSFFNFRQKPDNNAGGSSGSASGGGAGGYDYYADYYGDKSGGGGGGGGSAAAGGDNIETWKDPLAGGGGGAAPSSGGSKIGSGGDGGWSGGGFNMGGGDGGTGAGYPDDEGGNYNKVPPQGFPGKKSKFNFQDGNGLVGPAATMLAFGLNKFLANKNNMGHGGGLQGLASLFGGGGGGGGMGGMGGGMGGMGGGMGGGRGSGNQWADMLLGAVGAAAGSKMGYDLTNQIPGAQKMNQSGLPIGMIGSLLGSIMGNKFVRG